MTALTVAQRQARYRQRKADKLARLEKFALKVSKSNFIHDDWKILALEALGKDA